MYITKEVENGEKIWLRFFSAREGAESIATSGIEDFATRYKSLAGEDELGLLFQQTLAGSQKAFKATSNSKYKALDEALTRAGNPNAVDITTLKKWAKGELKNIGAKSEWLINKSA